MAHESKKPEKTTDKKDSEQAEETIKHEDKTEESQTEAEHEGHEQHAEHEEMEHEDASGEHDHHMEHDDSHDKHSMDHHNMGHGSHAMHTKELKRKFFISLILGIPIMLLSPVMGINLPFQQNTPNSSIIVLVLATILFVYGGSFFIKGAITEFKERSPGMMALISLGISVAYFYSLYAFINNQLHPDEPIMDFFWELTTLIIIMLLGHYLEMKAIANAGDALGSIAALLPKKANLLIKGEETKLVDLQDIKEGDVLVVNPHDKIPSDGVIIEGSTSVDESMLTGESELVAKKLHDKVIGGSLNSNHLIKIKVENVGEKSYLNQVMQLVEAAQKDKSRVETLSDKVAKLLFYVALLVSIIAFIVWFNTTKDVSVALERMVSVLIIACPHALGLAIPLVVARFTSLGAQNGLIIKNRNILEKADDISTVFLDKTGTLTEGKFQVQEVLSFHRKYDKDDILTYIASLEAASNHPIAVSILNKAKEFNLKLLPVDDIKNIAGVGMQGKIKRKTYLVTNMKYLDEKKISYPQEEVTKLLDLGYTLSFLTSNRKCIGVIGQGDKVRSQSYQAIDEIYNMRINPIMVTGDNLQAGYKVAEHLGITDFYTELMPEDKEKLVKEYQDKGDVVAMVGDGINDAISLARANVGIAIGAGTDVAVNSADVILVKNNPLDVVTLFKLLKSTYHKMIHNLWWAAGYNIIAIPLAAGVLAPIGITLSPAVGAILMSLSTIIVALNAMTLHVSK